MIHRHLSFLFFAVFPTILVMACDGDRMGGREFHESEKHSFSRFIEGIERFPYVADQQKNSRVREGFKRLSIGMHKDDVKKAMGEPDSEMFEYSKTNKDKELVGSTWGYYLKRTERNLATPNYDEAVFLYFKPNNELYWAQPENVNGLETLGAPLSKTDNPRLEADARNDGARNDGARRSAAR